ncbi:MAG: 4-hydroxythreonine-4-phosphate dehydrogenase PdxA [Acidobacteriaceae bacterium]|nr:4-hydroxythreonine-4-phosphate dehydrogenase PdxA [Acidobacteriaceae bacterium]
MRKPRIGLLLGDPSGVGPELVAKLLALPESREAAEITVIGSRRIYEEGLKRVPLTDSHPQLLCIDTPISEYPVGRVNAESGRYVLESLRVAVTALQSNEIEAIVFAPLNKQAMKLAGLQHRDELHYFAELIGHTGPVSEINVGTKFWTSRVTSHVPFREIAFLLTREKIYDAALLLDAALRTAGIVSPRIAIAGLNPHGGEGGTLGTEEMTIIGPAVDMARDTGMNASGPWPADTLFFRASRGEFDGVVTMYHDQGQIALKLLNFDRGVTLAGGLPFTIATPAHGTAFDIAGKGTADVGSLREALSLAARIEANRLQALIHAAI